MEHRVAKNFKFKLSEELFYDFYHCLEEGSVEADTVYSAVQSEVNQDQYMISWFDNEKKSIESTQYKRETVEEALKEGSWILVEEEEGELNVKKTV